MTASEVKWVLDRVLPSNDWVGSESNLEDIPLERIDRDNADNLDSGGFVDQSSPIHTHSEDLQQMNYIGASLQTRPQEPLGTEFDLQGDAVVSVRVEGAHVSEWGAIDPQDGSHDWPTTTWDELTNNIRRSIQSQRVYPNVGRSNTSYKDSFVENWTDNASNFSDYYLLNFDVRFSGFEELP